MKAPKRKKKLAVGGTIKGYQQPIAEPDEFRTDFGAQIHDMALMNADALANATGFDIKEKRYKTKESQQANQIANQAGTVGKQVIAGGLNFLAPGAGTLYNTATTGISQMQGPDEGLDANTQKNIEGINQVGGITNALFSLTGITKDNSKGIFAKNEEDEDDAGLPAKKSKGGRLVNGNVLKGKSHKQGGIKVEVEDGEEVEAEHNEIILTKGVYENPKLRGIASAINVAAGGKPITAETDDYAEGGVRLTSTGNKKADELIDKAYNTKNLSPKEIESIIEQAKALTGYSLTNQIEEINNLRSYAHSQSLAKDKANSKLAVDNKIIADKNNAVAELKKAGANESEIKTFEDAVKNQKAANVIGIKLDEVKSKVLERTSSEQTKAKAENYKKQLDAIQTKAFKEYQKVNSNPENYTPEQIAKARKQFLNVSEVRDQAVKHLTEKNYERVNQLETGNKEFLKNNFGVEPTKSVSTETNPLKPTGKATAPTVSPFADQTVSTQKAAAQGPTGTNGTPSPVGVKVKDGIAGATSNTAKVQQQKAIDDKAKGQVIPAVQQTPVTPSTADSLKISTVPRTPTDEEIDQQVKDLAVAEDERLKKEALQSATVPPAAAQSTATTPKAKTPYDFAQGIGLMQTGLGLAALAKDGNAPVYQANQQLIDDANALRSESDFGFNPLTMSGAKQDIEATRRMANKEAQNLTGGDAASQLAFQTATGINANKSYVDLARESENYRLQKRQAQYGLDQGVAAEMAKAFQGKLDLFNNRQMAGATLMQAGIKNAIEAQRYKTEQGAIAERSNIGKSATSTLDTLTEADKIKRYNELKLANPKMASYEDWVKTV